MHVLIIGGSKGIGRAIAEKYLKEGHHVGISYNTTEPEYLSEYPKDQSFSAKLDVQDENEIPEFFKKFKGFSKNKIDIFVYNTGITIDGLTIHGNTEDFDKVMNVNLKGAYCFLKEVGYLMYYKKKGKMFFLSSVAAKRGGRGQLSYAASKAGLEALVRVGAQEFSRAGIMINGIAPGIVETDMTESVLGYLKTTKKSDGIFDRIAMRRLAQPSEIANFVHALSLEEITYITGQTFNIDGGYML
ncbi:MAG: SDR family oxidoreductase [Candidatus Cloacimonetes bacterium]|nr:SDR family oxidoreductase [Candidatus Cloacimonadota bacterium]